eukprot:403361448
MDKIYDTLSQEKKIGLFESPTGTVIKKYIRLNFIQGKSLSLVCAILTWYLGKDKQVKCEKSDIKKDAKEDDWLSMFGAPVTNEVSNKPQVRNLNQKRVFKNLNSNDIREVQQNLKRKKEARLVNQSQQPNLNDEHLLNYDSDKEKTQQKLKQISQKAKSLGQSSNNHHQLNSLQQKGLCVHEKFKDIASTNLLNEKCQDLTEKSKCIYNDQELTDIFSNIVLEKVQDIEEIGKSASELKICGYFGSRKAMAEADFIVTPYQSILSESTRDSLGISLNNKVLIFDEAHNIMETICSLNTVSISLTSLEGGFKQISAYQQKYGNRLAAKNQKYLKDILKIVDTIRKYLFQKQENRNETNQQPENTKQQPQQTINVMDFLIETDLYSTDFVKLYEFFEKSDLVRKLNGFIQSSIMQQNQTNQKTQNKSKPNLDEFQPQTFSKSVLYEIRDFIRILSHNPDDGKFILDMAQTMISNKDQQKASQIKLTYLCLNPTSTLKRILDQVKAVIFISGTLEPSQEFNMLLKHVQQDQVQRFNCDHIIPKQHFQALVIPSYNSSQMDFRHQQRQSDKQMQNLIDIIIKSCEVSPSDAGVIVFLQSYGYKQIFLNFFRKQNEAEYEKLKEARKVYEELQNSQVDVFAEYSKEILQKKQGAILFCVIGGKLSEGINFSDNLARTLIVAGLPYPNSMSVEIQEKMRYFDTRNEPGFKGSDFYENLCMKTLNQSIGRAIRHINDYACIILVDQRFSNKNIQNKLPKWIQSRIKEVEEGENQLAFDIQRFFKYF